MSWTAVIQQIDNINQNKQTIEEKYKELDRLKQKWRDLHENRKRNL